MKDAKLCFFVKKNVPDLAFDEVRLFSLHCLSCSEPQQVSNKWYI